MQAETSTTSQAAAAIAALYELAPDDRVRITRALGHPLRLRFYELIRDSEEPLSVKNLADATGNSIPLAAYHTRLLRDAGLLEQTGQVQRRGALETFYRAVA